MIGTSFPIIGRVEPMCGKLFPMCGKRLPRVGKIVPRARRTLPEVGRLVPMIANVSAETRKEAAVRGESVPRAGRAFRGLVACHPWDGTSDGSFFA